MTITPLMDGAVADESRMLKIADALDSLRDRAMNVMRHYDHAPNRNSIAEREIRKHPEVKEAHKLGIFNLLFAVDHIQSAHNLISEGIALFTPWTCARAALEASATTLWLLDTEIGCKERMTRYLNIALQKHEVHRSRFSTSHDTNQDATDAYKNNMHDSIEMLRKQAGELGIEEKLNKKQQLIGFGTGMPKLSDLIDQHFDYGKAMYRHLSLASHGDLSMSVAFGMQKQRVENMEYLTGNRNPKTITMLIYYQMHWIARMAWSYFKLYGWDTAKLQQILEEEYNRASVKQEVRFWRKNSPA